MTTTYPIPTRLNGIYPDCAQRFIRLCGLAKDYVNKRLIGKLLLPKIKALFVKNEASNFPLLFSRKSDGCLRAHSAAHTGGNMAQAAKLLSISERALWAKRKKYGLK